MSQHAHQPADGSPEPGLSIDMTVPHSARVWNYWLGGKDHYDSDRAAGDAVLKVFPQMKAAALQSRAFLRKAVSYLAEEAGIRQFLDVGTGLPTAANTHEIAQRAAPDAHIVYADNDPVVLLHAQALLTGNPPGQVHYLDADLRDTGDLLTQARAVLDFDRPIALLLMGILGHIGVTPHDPLAAFTDPDAAREAYAAARRIVQALVGALPSRSALALYEFDDSTEEVKQAGRVYAEAGALPYLLRSREQIAGYFDGLDLVDPGLVHPTEWRPGSYGDCGLIVPVWCGIGVKP
ncbi:SAM-dependent methyltransferase [Thermomonospora umbrina]|uniref:S-adenosyl methyltransferase n=1 Tax=Thermomonospora umbrina TaxID=111806 RepID=A0A3D9SXB5_9ACTN|nr:SAM-dependent methyltransferase [Thermomonospora umbrina]REF00597.1 S-adenosyl methyltransferase [Thermomonospora umbrina]